jgi:hypothetical protein
MRFVRILSLVLLVGFCAVIARADATTTDPIYKFDDPTCTPGPDCLVFTYNGPTGFVPILTFTTTMPDMSVPDTSCNPSPSFLFCEVLQNGFFCPPGDFCGVSFQLGFLTHGEMVDLQFYNPEGGSVPAIPGNLLPPADLAPEPNTGVLFMSGLLLVFLGSFARKRLGASLGA